MVISEFLAALGLKDNFSGKLDKLLKSGEKSVGKWRAVTAKQFTLAGVAVGGFLATAAVGIFKFAKKLASSDDEVNQLARDLGVSRDEAFATKSAMDAMGKSLDEIQADPDFLRQFEDLKATATQMKPPDLSEGLSSIRALGEEFTKTKQIAMMGFQWIGHYFLKHVQKPIADLQGKLKGLNEAIVKAMPKITEVIGKGMIWFVRLGTRIIDVAQVAWKVISKLLDMVPGKVKGIGIALLALNKILKMGPLGGFIMLISAALLLLDDFFTFLESGDALLSPVWEALANLFSGFQNSGKSALDWFSEDFLPGLLDILGQMFPQLLDKALSFLNPVLDIGVKIIDGLIRVISSNAPRLVALFGDIAVILIGALLAALPDVINAGSDILSYLMAGMSSMVPELVNVGMQLLEKLLSVLFDGGLLGQVFESGMNLVLSLVSGIGKALPNIAKVAISLVLSLLSIILSHLPDIILAGIQILLSLIKGLWEAGGELFKAGVGIGVVLLEALAKIPEKMKDAGKSLIRALWDGILSMGTWLKDKVSGFFSGVIDGAKGLFGIESGSETSSSYGGGSSRGGGASRLPGHEDGGIFTEEHTARVVEGNNPEAIVPLTKPKRAAEVLNDISAFLGADHSDSPALALIASLLEKGVGLLDTILSVLDAAISRLTQLLKGSSETGDPAKTDLPPTPVPPLRPEEPSIPDPNPDSGAPPQPKHPSFPSISALLPYLEKGISLMERLSVSMDNMSSVYSGLQAVPAFTGGGNVYNNQQYTLKSDIKVYGNDQPQATGKMVDNNQKKLLRDLKGMEV